MAYRERKQTHYFCYKSKSRGQGFLVNLLFITITSTCYKSSFNGNPPLPLHLYSKAAAPQHTIILSLCGDNWCLLCFKHSSGSSPTSWPQHGGNQVSGSRCVIKWLLSCASLFLPKNITPYSENKCPNVNTKCETLKFLPPQITNLEVWSNQWPLLTQYS